MGKLKIDLQRFEVKEKQEMTKDEAYLWIFGILIDTNTFGAQNYIIEKRPTDGNLGDSFAKGEARAIPSDLGEIVKQVEPIRGKFAAGVVVSAWEHDTLSKDKQKDAYGTMCRSLNEFIHEKAKAAVGDIISGEDPDVEPSDAELRALNRQIEDEIREIFKGKAGVLNAIKAAVGHFDDNIGTCDQLEVFSTDDTRPRGIEFRFKPEGKSIDYRLNGTMRYEV